MLVHVYLGCFAFYSSTSRTPSPITPACTSAVPAAASVAEPTSTADGSGDQTGDQTGAHAETGGETGDETGAQTGAQTGDQTGDEMWCCTEPGCSRSFCRRQALEFHLLAGKHDKRLERESVFDTVGKMWASKCFGVSSKQQPVPSTTEDVVDATASTSVSDDDKSKMGWALKENRKAKRFSAEVKTYLQGVFDLGEKTGIKAIPEQVAQQMRTMFRPDNWLTSRQITGVFSRLAAAARRTGEGDYEAQQHEHDQQQLLQQI